MNCFLQLKKQGLKKKLYGGFIKIWDVILNFDRPLTLQSVSTMRSAFAGERKALSRVVPTVGASAIPSERRVTSARVPKPRPAASPPKDIMRPSREAGTDRWRAISFNCLTTAHWFLLCLWYQCVLLMLLRQFENGMKVPRLKAFGVSKYWIY